MIKLTDKYGGDDLGMVRGFGIFFDKAGETTPAVFTHFLSKLIAAPEVCSIPFSIHIPISNLVWTFSYGTGLARVFQ